MFDWGDEFGRSVWTAVGGEGCDQGVVMALPIGAKRPAEQHEVGDEGIAVRFLVEGFLVLRGQGSFAGQEQGAVFLAEEIVEFGAKTKIDGREGRQGTDVNGEKGGVLGLPLDVDKPTQGEFLQHPVEGGNGDVGQAGEVFVAQHRSFLSAWVSRHNRR